MLRLVPVLTATLLFVAAASQAQQPAKFTAPRTPWGDPDLQGSYSNKDENGTPFERPADLAGKSISDFGLRAVYKRPLIRLSSK